MLQVSINELGIAICGQMHGVVLWKKGGTPDEEEDDDPFARTPTDEQPLELVQSAFTKKTPLKQAEGTPLKVTQETSQKGSEGTPVV